MNKRTNLWICLFFIGIVYAQSDQAEMQDELPSQFERSETLNALYEEAKVLENTGTASEIEANRLAIKAEWSLINPEVASLYKPINAVTHNKFGYNGTPYVPEIIVPRPQIASTRDWDTDRLIREDFIDGVDMEVTSNGDIYIIVYENDLDAGGAFDPVYIYKSVDNGANWELWQELPAFNPVRKIQLIQISGSGDEFLLAYAIFENGLFQGLRWNLDSGDYTIETIDTDVSDFSVDRNYPTNTASQRVFATYLKDDVCATRVYSARSTAGDYGLNWVDAVDIDNVCGSQIELAYGRNGSTYTVYTGAASGNLYVNVNDNFNDPASWTSRETLDPGNFYEFNEPIIRAARKSLASDEVLVITSRRPAGTANEFGLRSYRRENGGAFSNFFNGIPAPNYSDVYYDTWVRKSNDVEEIRLIWTLDFLDNSENGKLQIMTYDGDELVDDESVSDSAVNVWDGFGGSVAETSDNLPCVAFAGTNGGVAYGLYYDAETVILNTSENQIEGLIHYPNPVGDVLNIRAGTIINEISVSNVLGERIIQISPNALNVELPINSVSSGVYIVSVSSEGKNGRFKIVKR
jgi:hypothetical protein